MEKTHDAICPRCKAIVLGAANCCWQCGEYVLVETQSALTGNAVALNAPLNGPLGDSVNGPRNGHGSIAEPVPNQFVQAETGTDTVNGQSSGVHFIGDSAEPSHPAMPVSDTEVLSAELIDDADPNGIVLGPTVLHGHAAGNQPREVRSGSPFSGVVDVAPQKFPALPSMAARPKQESGWHNVLIDAAPYGSLPLVIYAVLSAWGAGWSFKAGIVSAFFAVCFGLPGLLGPRWKWCLGAMIIAAPILVIASWQILLGR